MKSSQKIFFLAILFASIVSIANGIKEGECEVCVKTIARFASTLSEDIKKDPKKIEAEFKKFCKGSKNKENRLVSIKRQKNPDQMIFLDDVFFTNLVLDEFFISF
jgi:hypothetical protein